MTTKQQVTDLQSASDHDGSKYDPYVTDLIAHGVLDMFHDIDVEKTSGEKKMDEIFDIIIKRIPNSFSMYCHNVLNHKIFPNINIARKYFETHKPTIYDAYDSDDVEKIKHAYNLYMSISAIAIMEGCCRYITYSNNHVCYCTLTESYIEERREKIGYVNSHNRPNNYYVSQIICPPQRFINSASMLILQNGLKKLKKPAGIEDKMIWDPFEQALFALLNWLNCKGCDEFPPFINEKDYDYLKKFEVGYPPKIHPRPMIYDIIRYVFKHDQYDIENIINKYFVCKLYTTLDPSSLSYYKYHLTKICIDTVLMIISRCADKSCVYIHHLIEKYDNNLNQK